MLNFDSDQNNDDLQIVDDNFSISSGYNDPSAFFNMNPQNNFNSSSSYTSHINGGISSLNCNRYSHNDQNVTPTAPQQDSGPKCDKNCGACIWSFLCKKTSSNYSSIGVSAPKLA